MWFDKNNSDLDPALKLRPLRRCYYNERAGLRLALEVLAKKGHRRAAYVSIGKGGWSESRFFALKGLAREVSHTLEIYRDEKAEFNSWLEMSQFPESEMETFPASHLFPTALIQFVGCDQEIQINIEIKT